MVDYAATKGAIVGFTRSLALQLVPKGIRVNAVAWVGLTRKGNFVLIIFNSPGAIYTPIQVDTKDPESMAGWGSNKQLGRPGQASEVATSFIFLASKDASLYCTFLWGDPFTELANIWADGQILHCYPLGD